MYQYFKILHYVVLQLDYLKYFIYENFVRSVIIQNTKIKTEKEFKLFPVSDLS